MCKNLSVNPKICKRLTSTMGVYTNDTSVCREMGGSLGYGEINLYITSWIGSWLQSPLPATICSLVAPNVDILQTKFLNDGHLKALKIPILYLINGDEFSFLQGWRG